MNNDRGPYSFNSDTPENGLVTIYHEPTGYELITTQTWLTALTGYNVAGEQVANPAENSQLLDVAFRGHDGETRFLVEPGQAERFDIQLTPNVEAQIEDYFQAAAFMSERGMNGIVMQPPPRDGGGYASPDILDNFFTASNQFSFDPPQGVSQYLFTYAHETSHLMTAQGMADNPLIGRFMDQQAAQNRLEAFADSKTAEILGRPEIIEYASDLRAVQFFMGGEQSGYETATVLDDLRPDSQADFKDMDDRAELYQETFEALGGFQTDIDQKTAIAREILNRPEITNTMHSEQRELLEHFVRGFDNFASPQLQGTSHNYGPDAARFVESFSADITEILSSDQHSHIHDPHEADRWNVSSRGAFSDAVRDARPEPQSLPRPGSDSGLPPSEPPGP